MLLIVILNAVYIIYAHLQGLNWSITIQFSEKAASLKAVILKLFQVEAVFEYDFKTI